MASFGAPDRARDFAIVGRRALDAEAFRNAVATHLSGRVGSNRDVLVFVHGFNTGFDEARFRLAQIVTDGGFNGVPVLFTWPSKGSLFGYGSDREAATASRDAMEHLLLDLAALPDVGKVHVLAHSMGSWLAMEALREVAIAGHPDLDGHLGDIILAAPDIDQGVFRQQVERLGPGAHISVFAATNDRALGLSGFLAERPRLGAIDSTSPDGRAALEGLGVHVIDLTRDSVGLIGHATYASVPEVIRGIGAEIGASRAGDRNRQAVLGGEPDAPQFEKLPAPVVATPLPAPQAPAIAVP
ncbi:alpha/beta fold hydrolase [Lichenibacterium minor]|uniref:Alpha/beta fold hydrolase n=2 Tax=Lichenibacterium minor TaxID=2316528 RepID=A0A4V1RV13_9HYPH|nr:alpha/beta fold hydrolase [Lichenibacterium minor]